MIRRLHSAAVVLATGLAFATGALAQDRVFFGIATGGTGGTYYPLGGMLAQLISNKVTIGGNTVEGVLRGVHPELERSPCLANARPAALPRRRKAGTAMRRNPSASHCVQ